MLINQIIEVLFKEWLLISVFMAWGFFCQLGNMWSGAWLAKKYGQFSWSAFIKGFITIALYYVGFVWTVFAVAILPLLLNHFQIVGINMDTISAFTGYSTALFFAGYGIAKILEMGIRLKDNIGYTPPEAVVNDIEGVG